MQKLKKTRWELIMGKTLIGIMYIILYLTILTTLIMLWV